MTKPDMEKRPEQVSEMFDAVAPKYDQTNDLLSFGQSRIWRKSVRKLVSPTPGQRILDLAAGTGTSSMALTGPGISVVAADFSKGMLAEGRKRHPELEFAFADAMALPFKNSEFDTATISFGIRNVNKVDVALAEILRVLKPGGKLVICEFSHVRGFLGVLYRGYLRYLLPLVAKAIARNSPAYSYLGESIEAWPDQRSFASQIANAGFTEVGYKNLSFGVVAIHHAKKGS